MTELGDAMRDQALGMGRVEAAAVEALAERLGITVESAPQYTICRREFASLEDWKELHLAGDVKIGDIRDTEWLARWRWKRLDGEDEAALGWRFVMEDRG